MQTYLFYDIETSGLNPAFDQILTFAAIRTDHHLDEIEREEIRLRWRRDIVPSPGALITHRLSKEMLKSGLLEYHAAERIHGLVNRPGTVSLGYNTLGFDDAFLRFTFYRNLLEPYTHQYSSRCSRMDLLPMATLYRIFKPEILRWPRVNDKPSLKLEMLNLENSLFSSGRAHDAMTDVEVTLALARRLAAEKEIWQYCLSFFDKKTDLSRLNKMEKGVITPSESYTKALMVDPSMGADNLFMAPVLGIGCSNKYSNQTLWLRLDREDFAIHFDDPEKSWVIRKRLGESRIILPPLPRFQERLSVKQKALCRESLDAIARRPDEFRALADYHREFVYPEVPDIDPDASLYQHGFFTSREKKDIRKFRGAHPGELVGIWRTISSSPRLKSLVKRVLARNFSDLEGAPGLQEHISILRTPAKGKIPGYRGDFKFNKGDAQEEMKKLLAGSGLDREQKDLLNWLQGYLADF